MVQYNRKFLHGPTISLVSLSIKDGLLIFQSCISHQHLSIVEIKANQYKFLKILLGITNMNTDIYIGNSRRQIGTNLYYCKHRSVIIGTMILPEIKRM